MDFEKMTTVETLSNMQGGLNISLQNGEVKIHISVQKGGVSCLALLVGEITQAFISHLQQETSLSDREIKDNLHELVELSMNIISEKKRTNRIDEIVKKLEEIKSKGVNESNAKEAVALMQEALGLTNTRLKEAEDFLEGGVLQ